MAYRNTFFRWLFLYSLTFGLTYVLKLFTYLCPETGHITGLDPIDEGTISIAEMCIRDSIYMLIAHRRNVYCGVRSRYRSAAATSASFANRTLSIYCLNRKRKIGNGKRKIDNRLKREI